MKILNKDNMATIGGYLYAAYNALFELNIDSLDYHLPSTYLKLFGAIILPIFIGHMTEFKGAKKA